MTGRGLTRPFRQLKRLIEAIPDRFHKLFGIRGMRHLRQQLTGVDHTRRGFTLKCLSVQLVLFLSLSSSLFAQNTLSVSLINLSSSQFLFERSSVEFPNNTIAIEPKLLIPGESANITGTTTLDEDLSAILYFKGDAELWILDKRQFHIGQPIFAFLSNDTTSQLVSRTPNPTVGARLLSYVAAKIVIRDK